MPPFEALYGQRCRSMICWKEVGNRKIHGSDLIQETTEKIKIIRRRMKTAQSGQKAYVDHCCRSLAFLVGDKVFLKVSLIKGVLRVNRKSKLDSQFVGPFKILERVGLVAYRLALPQSFKGSMCFMCLN